MIIEERSERLKKLHDIQEKYGIHLKTKKTESGEEVLCMDVPFSQKIRNESNNYHYFFEYKRDRFYVLKNSSPFEGRIEPGMAHRLLLEMEEKQALKKEKVRIAKESQAIYEKMLLTEKEGRRKKHTIITSESPSNGGGMKQKHNMNEVHFAQTVRPGTTANFQ